MNFEFSDKVKELQKRVAAFMEEHVYPNEKVYAQQVAEGGRWCVPPVMEEMKAKARAAGLWNLFLPASEHGAGLTNLEYAPLCEIMGRSPIAPEAFNCSAPDTGNMEVLERYGSPELKEQWLKPLLAAGGTRVRTIAVATAGDLLAASTVAAPSSPARPSVSCASTGSAPARKRPTSV